MKITAALIAGCMLAAGTLLRASDQALLGSPDFYPSPEHPVGWRGDGSGRFPGATPPTNWNRRLADITSEIVVQATRPNDKPGPDSHRLEYCTINDWLVAGPFPVTDCAKDIDHDFLGGEADIQPATGAKAGDQQWKLFHAFEGSQACHDMNQNNCLQTWVDFVYAFGTLVPRERTKHWNDGPKFTVRYADLEKQAAYAHTYLYAPRPADVVLDILHDLPAVKMWMNGSPQVVFKKGKGDHLKIHLNQGWNRLLVKAICDPAQAPNVCAGNYPKDELGQIKWRFSAYLTPAGACGYETRNVAWMLKLTGRNMSQPITVGDKLFVASNNTDLFCIDKRSGKILWLHTGTCWDAMTVEERAAIKATAEPLLAELEKSNAELVARLNANVGPQGLAASAKAVLDKKLEERNKFLKSLHDAIATGPGKKGKLYINGFNFSGDNTAGNAAPTSDGQRVYWVTQGDGGYLTSAFDLNGKLIWSNLEFQNKSAGEHGVHGSPLLYGGKLYFCTMGGLIARDASTGKELWRVSGRYFTERPMVVQFNGQPALQTPKELVSLSGEVLVKGGYAPWCCYVPVMENGVLYNCSNPGDLSFEAIAIPAKDGEKHQVIWKVDGKTLYDCKLGNRLGFYIASPLYVDGLVYQVETAGYLVVIDTREKKPVCQRFMDDYNVNGYRIYGHTASPTLAGKNIYLMSCVGGVTILKPGSDCIAVGQNTIQNIASLPDSAPCGQEVFYSGLWFDGKQMFIHGDEYLYCIEEK